MVTNVLDFKNKLTGGGARANLFRVELQVPTGIGAQKITENSNFLVKTAEIPGSTITPIIIPFRGRQLKVSGDRTFDPWTVTVINDTDFAIRRSIEQWMSAMNNHEDNQGLNDGYFADLQVHQLDRNGKDIKSYDFIGAWPSDLGPISVSYDNENQIQEYQITFQYQYWMTAGLNTSGK